MTKPAMRYSTSDIFLAYRQAKIELREERRGIDLTSLATFEGRLNQNLTRLSAKFSSKAALFDAVELGRVHLTPKSVKDKERTDGKTIRMGADTSPKSSLEVQLRLSPSIEFVIAEILFLWQYGPVLDGQLSSTVLGYRLAIRDHAVDKFKRSVFEFWPRRYEEFRTSTISAAEEQLSKSGTVTIVSADFTTFYDSVAAEFLIDSSFIRRLRRNALQRGAKFNGARYVADVKSLLRLHSTYRREARRLTGLSSLTCGIPIGALTSRLIANLALIPVDAAIAGARGVVSYRRYVDDVAIVCDWPGLQAKERDAVLAALFPLKQRGTLELRNGSIHRPNSRLQLSDAKSRVHHLAGVAGQEFLTSVASDFGTCSSFVDTST